MSTENLSGGVHQIPLLKYYIGSLVHCIGKGDFILVGINLLDNTFGVRRSRTQVEWIPISSETVRLNSRPIKGISCDELHHIAWLALNFNILTEDSDIDKDEVLIGLITRDGKVFPENFAISADLRCRHFDGKIQITKKGNVVLIDENDGIIANGNQPFIITYMLSINLDIFGTTLP